MKVPATLCAVFCAILEKPQDPQVRTGAAPRLFDSGGKILTTTRQCEPSKVLRKICRNEPCFMHLEGYFYVIIKISKSEIQTHNRHQRCGVEAGFGVGRSRQFC